MIWLLGIGMLVIFWFVFPPFRIFLLVVGGLVIALIAGFFFKSEYDESASKSLIPLSSIVFMNLSLKEQYGSYELAGEIKNNSDYELFGLVLKVTMYDCPDQKITPSCIAIGQDEDVHISLDIPAKQLRSIDHAFVSFYNMPQTKGNYVWSYEVKQTRGR